MFSLVVRQSTHDTGIVRRVSFLPSSPIFFFYHLEYPLYALAAKILSQTAFRANTRFPCWSVLFIPPTNHWLFGPRQHWVTIDWDKRASQSPHIDKSKFQLWTNWWTMRGFHMATFHTKKLINWIVEYDADRWNIVDGTLTVYAFYKRQHTNFLYISLNRSIMGYTRPYSCDNALKI